MKREEMDGIYIYVPVELAAGSSVRELDAMQAAAAGCRSRRRSGLSDLTPLFFSS